MVGVSVDSFLGREGGPLFDVIWLDPPYPFTNEQIARILQLALPRLVHNGLIVLERASRGGAPHFPEGTEQWTRRYGETTLHFCQREADDDQ